MTHSITTRVAFIAAITCLVMALPSQWVSSCNGQEEISIAQQWTGKVADPGLRKSSDGIIKDAESWKKLWAAWRPKQEVAAVDFAKQIVLVETVNGPNNVLTSTLKLDSAGQLKYEIASSRMAASRMAGDGFGYLLMAVPKEKINRVNGKLVEASVNNTTGAMTQPTGKPMKNSSGEMSSGKASSGEMSPEKTMPTKRSPVRRTTRPVQSINVIVNGAVQTGMNAIGGETTGNLIVANGIVWELELTDSQIAEANRIGRRLATVKGSLRKIRGVEIRERFIVTVESIVAASETEQSTGLVDNGSEGSGTRVPNQVVNKDRQPQQAAELNGFESITINISGTRDGGKQTQTISADGKANYWGGETPKSWQVSPETLAQLHKFIKEMDWKNLPPVSRASTTGDVISFEVSISTKDGQHRFFADTPSVIKNPTMKQLFLLLRRPDR